MYEMEIGMMPIITFADRITFSLLWMHSALRPDEAPISLSRKRPVIRLSKITRRKDLCVPTCSW